jgi:hypothetical protein
MTLNLNLPPELEQYLLQEASQQGLSVEVLTLQLLSKAIPQKDKQTAILDLVQSWIDEDDAEEQKETGEYLIQPLDEDRLSDRPLFPSEMKSITW